MRRTLPAILATLALAACGGGDDEKKSDTGGSGLSETPKTETSTSDTTTTGTSTSAGSPEDNPRAKEITACVKKAGLNVITNPATQVNGDYQLVINGGAAGVLYGFANDAAAVAGKSKVQQEEGSAGRKTEVIHDTVLAYFPAGQTLAEPEKTDKVRKCAA